jgi:3-oxoacyl-ACP reductase-like protein
VIFGSYETSQPYRYTQNEQTLPDVWRPKSGAHQDVLRQWLSNYAWTITGSQGLRAQASKGRLAHLEQEVRSTKNAHSYQADNLENLRKETPQNFRDLHEYAKKRTAEKIAAADSKIAQCERDLTTAATDDEGIFEFIAKRAGAWSQPGDWDSTIGNYGPSKLTFSRVNADWSHSPRSPNYVANVGTDGETVTLSSGIVCPFKRSDVVSWLQGKAQAPRTTYGKVERVDCATFDGQPRSLLRCGCHYIDAATIDAELAELLKPTHVVTRTEGKPAVTIDEREKFLARLNEELIAGIARAREERAEAITNYASRKHELNERESNLPAIIAAQEEKVSSALAAITKAEQDLANAPVLLGSSHADMVSTVAAILNSQRTAISAL